MKYTGFMRGSRLSVVIVGCGLACACSADSADQQPSTDAGVVEGGTTFDGALLGDDTGAKNDAFEPPCGSETQTGCEWSVPLRSNGAPANTDSVAIRLVDSDGETTQLLQVTGPNDCAELAWYVQAPDSGQPTRLLACPATCARINATGESVLVLPGCVN